MKRSTLITVVFISIVILIVGAFTWWVVTSRGEADSDAARALGTPEASDDAIVSPYRDLNGNPIDLTDYAGKVRVVNVWATWTPFSLPELKDLGALAAQFDAADVVVLAVNRAEPLPNVQAFVEQQNLDEEIVWIVDEADRFYDSVGGQSMPETVIYDSNGNIVQHYRGPQTLETFFGAINDMLNP